MYQSEGRESKRTVIRPSIETLESRVLLSAGDLDRTFGTRGIVPLDAAAGDLVVRSDGKFLLNVAGVIRRFNSDGSPDTTFANSGVLDPSMGVAGLAIDANGRLVVGGGKGDQWAIARYNANGSPDASFGSGGRVVTHGGDDKPESASFMALAPGGKIVLAGNQDTGLRDETQPWAEHEIAVARFNSNGTVDKTLAGDGELTTQEFDVFETFAVAPDGRMLVGGVWDTGMLHEATFVEFDSAGQKLTQGSKPNFSEYTASAYRADGSRVLGYWDTGNAGATLTDAGGESTQVAAWFDPLGGFAANNQCHGILVQPDGKVILAGYGGNRLNASGLMRLNADGTPDSTFGFGGSALLNLKKHKADWIDDAALTSDGDILVVAKIGGDPIEGSGFSRYVLARIEGGNALTAEPKPPAARAFVTPTLPYIGNKVPATFTVIYAGQQDIDRSTLDDLDVLIRGPHKFAARGHLTTVEEINGGRQIVASYDFPAPSGAWDARDAGKYGAFIRKNQVRDKAGNAVRAGRVGLGSINPRPLTTAPAIWVFGRSRIAAGSAKRPDDLFDRSA
jgi:uncharacterized delta-60 repeat protein